jgi:O-antigen ligase
VPRTDPPGPLDARDEKLRAVLVGAYVVGLGVSITLAETALFLAAVRAGWRLVRGRARIGWPLAGPIVALAAATFLAAALSARPVESLTSARSVFLLLAVWVVIDALPTVDAAARALLGLLAVLGLVSVLGIAQVAFCTEPWFIAAGAGVADRWPALGRFFVKCHRAHAFYSIYMTFGGVLATLPWLLPASARPQYMRVAWLLALAAFAVTYVRGAWLGFVAGGLTVVASIRHHRVMLLAGLAAAALALLLVPGVRGRARSMVDPNDPTSSERMLMWRSGLAMARDHLVTGVGPGQVKRVYPDYAAADVANKHRGHLHNTPLQILVERGLLGLAAWSWLFGAFLARGVRAMRQVEATRPRALATGAVAAVAGFLVAGLFEHNFGDTEVLLVALFVMAILFVVERDVRIV